MVYIMILSFIFSIINQLERQVSASRHIPMIKGPLSSTSIPPGPKTVFPSFIILLMFSPIYSHSKPCDNTILRGFVSTNQPQYKVATQVSSMTTPLFCFVFTRLHPHRPRAHSTTHDSTKKRSKKAIQDLCQADP